MVNPHGNDTNQNVGLRFIKSEVIDKERQSLLNYKAKFLFTIC